MICQIMDASLEDHIAMMGILRYLKATSNPKNNLMYVEAYTFVNRGGLMINRRFVSRYCTFMRDNLLTWKCKKQFIATKTSVKIEF